MPRHEIEHEIRGAACKAPKALATLTAEHRLELAGIVFEAGDDLAAIAARRPPPGHLGIDDDDITPDCARCNAADSPR